MFNRATPNCRDCGKLIACRSRCDDCRREFKREWQRRKMADPLHRAAVNERERLRRIAAPAAAHAADKRDAETRRKSPAYRLDVIERAKKNYRKNPQKQIEYVAAWAKKNRDKRREYSRRHMAKKRRARELAALSTLLETTANADGTGIKNAATAATGTAGSAAG